MKNALLVSSFLGILWLVLLFAFSFFCVHLYKLAKLGQKYRKEKQAENKKTQNTPTSPTPAPAPIKKDEKKLPEQKQGEPIYYIVERKRKKKPQFSEPKRIQFK